MSHFYLISLKTLIVNEHSAFYNIYKIYSIVYNNIKIYEYNVIIFIIKYSYLELSDRINTDVLVKGVGGSITAYLKVNMYIYIYMERPD